MSRDIIAPMNEQRWEIYPGQRCKICGEDLQSACDLSIESTSSEGVLLHGRCGNCGDDIHNLLAKAMLN